MHNTMETSNSFQDKSALNERRLGRTNDPMSSRRETSRKGCRGEFRHIVNKSDRSKQPYRVSPFNFGDEGKHGIIKSGNINRAKAKANVSGIKKMFNRGAKLLEEGNRETIRARCETS